MFAAIARRYDRANSVLSFGRHRGWRRRAVRLSGAKAGARVLDVATGTADLGFAFRKAVGPSGVVAGADFCRPMLVEAASKSATQGRLEGLVEADALRLPFRDASFDVASIGFGIRNVDDARAGLVEMARVVKPRGRVVVLEFGQPRGLLARPYRLYSRHVLPRVGGWITGERSAYEYLPRTAAAFPSGEAFPELMHSTRRFADVRAYPLSGGIAYVYVGLVGPAEHGAQRLDADLAAGRPG
jgi:demethylmenaquinone methyltransferase/2-methoxy-6-polyprenyl-1,4-benzoquinol methylase